MQRKFELKIVSPANDKNALTTLLHVYICMVPMISTEIMNIFLNTLYRLSSFFQDIWSVIFGGSIAITYMYFCLHTYFKMELVTSLALVLLGGGGGWGVGVSVPEGGHSDPLGNKYTK